MADAEKTARAQDDGSRRSSRRSDKKRELAKHAIATLGKIGYARTSLRDIAEQSGVSLGVLHYYFEDKNDLISFCVLMYKDRFVEALNNVVDESPSPDIAIRRFIDGLVATVSGDTPTHTLWYDINAQALFDPVFRPVVREIEEALISLVSRTLAQVGVTNADAAGVYMTCDGIFRHHLLRHACGEPQALDNMRNTLLAVFLRETGQVPALAEAGQALAKAG